MSDATGVIKSSTITLKTWVPGRRSGHVTNVEGRARIGEVTLHTLGPISTEMGDR